MAMQLYTGASSSSSSSSSSVVSSNFFYVFISFRGEDTRKKFTSHLYDALTEYFETFIDENELEKGDEISSALIEAIEKANASIVVFSENYASSKWCLDELVKILKCKKEQGQIVIPVFYEVDPSHVRNQRGSYGQAFEKHEQDLRQSKDKLQKWRNALTEAANLSGWHFQNDKNESNFIKDIVKDVLEKLFRRHPIEVNEDLVGIEKKNNEVESLMKIGTNDVKTLGLWGMGGIGKTTLAKDVYAKRSSQFKHHCFLENIREESTRCGLRAVRNKLFSALLELPLDAPYVETPIFMRKLAREKCFIVLDDVTTLEQAQNFNIVKCLGPGSRVILTTRDKQIFNQFDECEIYKVEPFNEDDSLRLFCQHAFPKNHAIDGYEELLERAIGYCGGNPLALKVLGANFRKKSKEVWESELEKLKKIPNRRIHDVLKLSYHDLDPTQQGIFLDIACFCSRFFGLRNTDRNFLTALFDACEFFGKSGIEDLLCKALIEVDFHQDKITMHDLLVEMGREIVKQEYPKDPGRRSRLWDSEDVYDILKYNKGTDAVEVIFFDITEIEDLYLRSDSFKSMINLRYLRCSIDIRFLFHANRPTSNIHFPKGLEWLSDKLKYLHWDAFPLESLPSTFCAKNLVLLSIEYSKLKKLWDGIQKLDNLMEINLNESRDLIEIPDLSMAPKLQIVNLINCESLCQLHPSIFTCPKLTKLNLFGCKRIKSLKTIIHSKFFQELDLGYCSSLAEFSVTAEEMTRLALHSTAIHEFPSSIRHNSKLIYLDLGGCVKLNIVRKKLSTDLGLRSLTKLNLSGCTEINTSNLWFILEDMPSLKVLHLNKCCNLETLPNNIQNNSSLENLKLDECIKLKSLQKLPTSLKQLTAVNCTYLDTNMLPRFHFVTDYYFSHFSYYNCPGGQVPYGFRYQTTKASIEIPRSRILISGLCGFIFCIVLSGGLNFDHYKNVACTIYKHGEEILHLTQLFCVYPDFEISKTLTLVLDHVLLGSCRCDDNQELVNMENESEGDHYNLSFEFKYFENGKWSTKGIKGCGVLPVCVLERMDGGSNSGVKIVELQSGALVFDDELDNIDEFDIDESVSDEYDQHLEFDDDSQNQSSTDEIEEKVATDDKEEDLNDKSSCACSIGILLKHLLEESKRYFS